jgi:hypothetical protein
MLLLLKCPGPSSPNNKVEDPPDHRTYLAVENIYSTSADLYIASPEQEIDKIIIYRDGKEVIDTKIENTSDTILIDTGLEPDSEYIFQAHFLKNKQVKIASDSVLVQTLPTTGHDFTWELDTIGINITELHDVEIVDEDDIWVVGEIQMPDPDSSWNGTGRERYNAIHWDGEEWDLMRLWDHDRHHYIGMERILYYSEDNIWLTSKGTINHYDGQKVEELWTIGRYEYGGIRNFWSSSESDMYFAGRKGVIVHYNGSEFNKMESGTDIQLRDIAGKNDNVFVTGWDYSGGSIALTLEEDRWQTLFESETYFGNLDERNYGKIKGVDVFDNTAFFSTKVGLVKYYFTNNLRTIDTDTHFYNHAYSHIHIQNTNDIFLLSGDGRLLHYNGASWQEDFSLNGIDAVFLHGNFDVKDDFVVAVGGLVGGPASNQGIIARGYRK